MTDVCRARDGMKGVMGKGQGVSVVKGNGQRMKGVKESRQRMKDVKGSRWRMKDVKGSRQGKKDVKGSREGKKDDVKCVCQENKKVMGIYGLLKGDHFCPTATLGMRISCPCQ